MNNLRCNLHPQQHPYSMTFHELDAAKGTASGIIQFIVSFSSICLEARPMSSDRNLFLGYDGLIHGWTSLTHVKKEGNEVQVQPMQCWASCWIKNSEGPNCSLAVSVIHISFQCFNQQKELFQKKKTKTRRAKQEYVRLTIYGKSKHGPLHE
jgi:hypothetical protein